MSRSSDKTFVKLQVVIRRQSIVKVGGGGGRGTFIFMLMRVLAKELDDAGRESFRADRWMCHQVFDDSMKKWAFEKSVKSRGTRRLLLAKSGSS